MMIESDSNTSTNTHWVYLLSTYCSLKYQKVFFVEKTKAFDGQNGILGAENLKINLFIGWNFSSFSIKDQKNEASFDTFTVLPSAKLSGKYYLLNSFHLMCVLDNRVPLCNAHTVCYITERINKRNY